MKNFFKGISFTQVLAGSLAAVTSFLLASKIGIAGSVIGVAIGSIVSAVASQLYQNVIHASSRKLAEANVGSSATANAKTDATADATADAKTNVTADATANANDSSNSLACDDTVILSKPANGYVTDSGYKSVGDDANMQPSQQSGALNSGRTISSHASDPELENTRVMELSALRKQREEDMALSDGADIPPISLSQAVNNAYVDSTVRGGYGSSAYRNASYQRNSNHRVTLIVAVVSALIAVVVTAGIVLLLTQGKGTDYINQPNPQPTQPQPQIQQEPRVRTDTHADTHKKTSEGDDSTENAQSGEESDSNNLHSKVGGEDSSMDRTGRESGSDLRSGSSYGTDSKRQNNSEQDGTTAGGNNNNGAGGDLSDLQTGSGNGDASTGSRGNDTSSNVSGKVH